MAACRRLPAPLARVHAPKADGTWTLQRACAHAPLRTGAYFSSVAALLDYEGDVEDFVLQMNRHRELVPAESQLAAPHGWRGQGLKHLHVPRLASV